MLKIIGLTITLCVGAFACGGDVCEDAAEIAKDKCGATVTSDGGEKAKCNGQAKKVAQCAVDHEDAYCSFLSNPMENAGNDYGACVASAGE